MSLMTWWRPGVQPVFPIHDVLMLRHSVTSVGVSTSVVVSIWCLSPSKICKGHSMISFVYQGQNVLSSIKYCLRVRSHWPIANAKAMSHTANCQFLMGSWPILVWRCKHYSVCDIAITWCERILTITYLTLELPSCASRTCDFWDF